MMRTPPLYILLVRTWETLIGDDAEAHVRLVGVIDSVVAVRAALLSFARANSSASPRHSGHACSWRSADRRSSSLRKPAGTCCWSRSRWRPALGLARLKRSPSIGAAILLGVAVLAMPLTHYFSPSAPRRRSGCYALFAPAAVDRDGSRSGRPRPICRRRLPYPLGAHTSFASAQTSPRTISITAGSSITVAADTSCASLADLDQLPAPIHR